MARNGNAGKTPSYDARNMSPAARKKKKAYDKKLNSSPGQIKKRSECNGERATAKKKGKNIKGKDYDHAVGGFVPTSTNRGRKGEGGRVKKR